MLLNAGSSIVVAALRGSPWLAYVNCFDAVRKLCLSIEERNSVQQVLGLSIEAQEQGIDEDQTSVGYTLS